MNFPVEALAHLSEPCSDKMGRSLCAEALCAEVWEHIFSFVPAYERDRAISSFRRANGSLRGHWIFDEINLAYLVKRQLCRRQARFIWECRKYVKYVIDTEIGNHPTFNRYPYKLSLMGQFIDNNMFQQTTRKKHWRVTATQCRCCNRKLMNAHFVALPRHLEGIRGYYTAFELRCSKCKLENRDRNDCPSITLLGTTFTGLLPSCWYRDGDEYDVDNTPISNGELSKDDSAVYINDLLTSGSLKL